MLDKRFRPWNDVIICENGVIRLRVVRQDHTLTVMIDACDDAGAWTTLACSPGEATVCQTTDAAEKTAAYTTMAPVQVNGRTLGVTLQGTAGAATVTFRSRIAPSGMWTDHRLEVRSVPGALCRRLTHAWHFAPEVTPGMYYPLTPLDGAALAGSSVAFLQADMRALALVPDLEECDEGHHNLQVDVTDTPARIRYSITTGAGQPALPSPPSLAYALFADARSLPQGGFQQVVRWLGSQEQLRLTAGYPALTIPATTPPPLPAPPDATAWVPFMHEGRPVEIVALVADALARGEQDWRMLEEGLRWLDRLCLQQCTQHVPDGPALGSLGTGPDWAVAAVWMPFLLFTAHALTSIPEYAYRGIAALYALPATQQSAALGTVSPTFAHLLTPMILQGITHPTAADPFAQVYTGNPLWYTVNR